MGTYLISWNNKLWELLLNNRAFRKLAGALHVPEALLSILVISAVVVFIGVLLCNRLLKKGFHTAFLCCRSLGYLYLVSVSLMIRQLPNIHHRLRNALRTAADVGRTYPKYTVIFEQEFGVDPENAGDVARCLYQMPVKDRILTDDFLFSHIYRTLDEVRGVVTIQWWRECILIVCVVGLLFAVMAKGKSGKLGVLIRTASLMFCSAKSAGLLAAGLTLWVIGLSISSLARERQSSGG